MLFAGNCIFVKPIEGPLKLDQKTRHLYTDDDENLVLKL